MDLWEQHFGSELGSNPKLIAMKRRKMAADPLDFYRGCAGIFYSLWSRQKPEPTPTGWICGDAHWENVGSYKGKNHVAYFDFTDFDDACLAPLGFDLGRSAACLYLLKKGALAPLFLSAYRKELAGGKPFHIEAEVARGTIAKLLKAVKNRSRKHFIAEHAKKGRLILDPRETYKLPQAERREAARIFRDWAMTMKNPPFFRLMDICGSYSGVGELGHRRYLALVKGRHAPHLIDMKEAMPSDAAPFSTAGQPTWANEAQRIAEIQRILQYVPIARLGWSRSHPPSFVFSEYQPSEDRVDSLALSTKEYRDFATQWGKLLAWSHLRGGGWKGSATTSELIAFAAKFDAVRQRRLLAAARTVAGRLLTLFGEFRDLVGAEDS